MPSPAPVRLLAMSDLHLGRACRDAAEVDRALVSLLDRHRAERQGGPWTLLLNGDTVDLVSITATPEGPAAFPVSGPERQRGLRPEEAKSAWKLRAALGRHPRVVEALARFVREGNRVVVVSGNHDPEWAWPAVQREFLAVLHEAGGGAPAELERRVRFAGRSFGLPGLLHAEHGHAFDPYCFEAGLFAPEGQGELPWPVASEVLWHFGNCYASPADVEQAEGWGARDFVAFWLRSPRRWALASDYVRMVLTLLAGAASGPRAALQRLGRVAQLFYLDRLAVLTLAALWLAGGAGPARWAGALGLALSGCCALGLARRTDSHPRLRQAAGRLQAQHRVPLVLLSHSHQVVDEGCGAGRYFNLGSFGAPARAGAGRPYFRWTEEGGGLCFWSAPEPEAAALESCA